MLAKINWVFFTKPEKYEEQMPGLIEAISHDLQNSGLPLEEEEEEDEEGLYCF